MLRDKTRKIKVGGIFIGGDAPVSVQSMCNTDTRDVEATLEQISCLAAAGCQVVRLAVPDAKAAEALPKIRKACGLPLVADIHFDYKLAIASAEAGFDKIRINPGNIGSADRVKAVVDACRANGTAIRIGVNGGSLEKKYLRDGGATPENLARSVLDYIHMLEDFGFGDICVSAKSSKLTDSITAARILAEKTDCPLHLGITETGTPYMGLVKSSVGIGAMLLEGIGSTIRVSLTADPVEEVKAGIALLKAAGLRREGVDIISCPTCGRTQVDIISMAAKVESLLADVRENVSVAVMGCVVNGPGEARAADYGLAGGKGEGLLFRKGEIVGKYPEENLVEALADLVRQDLSASAGG